MAIQVGQSVTTTLSPNLKLKEYVMKPEVNAVLQEVKASLAQTHQPAPLMPDFKTMSIMEATKWCLLEGNIDNSNEIAQLTGKSLPTVQTALWKLRNPKKVKAQYRRAKKLRDIKAGVVKEGVKATKPTKVAKPKITNGQYDDGMDTPYRDSIMRRGGSFNLPQSLAKATQWLAEGATKTTNIHNELMTENHRLKILIEHYESLLFKGGK